MLTPDQKAPVTHLFKRKENLISSVQLSSAYLASGWGKKKGKIGGREGEGGIDEPPMRDIRNGAPITDQIPGRRFLELRVQDAV